MFNKNDIPQADNLEKVIETVEAVNDGFTTDKMIAQAIGYSERQGRYYRHATEVLGFVLNNKNSASLTDTGVLFINSTKDQRVIFIRKSLYENPFFNNIINFTESKENGFSERELNTHISSITDNDTQATIARRTKTILSWLLEVAIIVEDEDIYKFNDLLEDAIQDDPEIFRFPATYDQEVDIKEEWFSVYELRRKIGQFKVVMNPDFQRNLVWKGQQKSQFIESIILNIPLPPLYFRKELNGEYIVVDGLQRTSTIDDFLSNKFQLTGLAALPDLNGLNFADLESRLQARIEDRKLLVYILQPQVPMKVVYDIFNRINTGGTKLERQEIRNCIFIGKATTLLKSLASAPEFREAIDNGISPTRMKDREAVLRCLAFTIFNFDKDYKNSMDDFLERTMKKINTMDDGDIEILKTEFLKIMSATKKMFGNNNFRLPTQFSRGRINIAVLESVYSFFSKNIHLKLDLDKDQLINNFNRLLQDENYRTSVKYSTGSTSQVVNRFYIANQILSTK